MDTENLNQQGEGQEQEVQAQEYGGQDGNVQGNGNNGDYIPKSSFTAVLNQLKAYQRLGKTEELQNKLKEHGTWSEAIQKYRQNQQQSQNGGEDVKAIRERLYQVAPELKALDELNALKAEIEQLRSLPEREAMADEASSYLSGKVNPNGKLTSKQMDKIEDFIFSQMNSDQQEEFLAGDITKIDEILDDLKKSGMSEMLFGRAATPTPPKRHSPGGMNKREPAKPMTMEDATTMAWQRMNEG